MNSLSFEEYQSMSNVEREYHNYLQNKMLINLSLLSAPDYAMSNRKEAWDEIIKLDNESMRIENEHKKTLTK